MRVISAHVIPTALRMDEVTEEWRGREEGRGRRGEGRDREERRKERIAEDKGRC